MDNDHIKQAIAAANVAMFRMFLYFYEHTRDRKFLYEAIGFASK